MTKLQAWMTKHDKWDADVARTVKRSRTQISRIRRGIVGASPTTARRLEALTKIKWWAFIGGKGR